MYGLHLERFRKVLKLNLLSVDLFNFYRCTDTCGGRIDTSNGTITSPSFPEVYPGNKTCTWEIIAPQQYKITLNFTHFDLEGNNVSNRKNFF